MATPGLPNPAIVVPAAVAAGEALEAVTKALIECGKVLKEALLPPLKLVTEGLKAVGDAIARLVLPPLQLVGRAFATVGRSVASGVTDMLGPIPRMIGSLLAPVGRSVVAALGGVGGMLGGFLGNVGGAGLTALGSLGKALGVVGMAAGAATGGVLLFGAALGGFVQKANPAVFDQFQLAMNDLMAVIGRALVPIFQDVVIPVVRTLADAFMGLAPIFATVTAALRPVISAMTDLLGEALATAIGLLGQAIQVVMPFVMAFGRILVDVFQTIMHWAKQLLAFVGIDLAGAEAKKGSSVGAAARQASHMSFEEVARAAQRSAYSLGTASSDPAAGTFSAVSELNKKADNIYNIIEQLPVRIWNFLSNLPGLIWNEFSGVMNRLGVSAAVESAVTAVEKAESTWDRWGDDVTDFFHENLIGPVAGVFGAERRSR